MEKTSSKTLPSKPGFGGRLPFRKIAPNIVTMLALCAGSVRLPLHRRAPCTVHMDVCHRRNPGTDPLCEEASGSCK